MDDWTALTDEVRRRYAKGVRLSASAGRNELINSYRRALLHGLVRLESQAKSRRRMYEELRQSPKKQFASRCDAPEGAHAFRGVAA